MSRYERYDHVLSDEFDDYEHRTTCRTCRSTGEMDDDADDGCDSPPAPSAHPACDAAPRFRLTLVVVLLAVGLATCYGYIFWPTTGDGRPATNCRWWKPGRSSGPTPFRPHRKCRSVRANNIRSPRVILANIWRSAVFPSAK